MWFEGWDLLPMTMDGVTTARRLRWEAGTAPGAVEWIMPCSRKSARRGRDAMPVAGKKQ